MPWIIDMKSNYLREAEEALYIPDAYHAYAT